MATALSQLGIDPITLLPESSTSTSVKALPSTADLVDALQGCCAGDDAIGLAVKVTQQLFLLADPSNLLKTLKLAPSYPRLGIEICQGCSYLKISARPLPWAPQGSRASG